MGAGVLKVDQAVLQVINDLRREQKLKPYSLEEALDLGRVILRATGGPKDYIITASIPSVLAGSADVKIDVYD